MCRTNCNIIEAENKEKREIKSRLIYEDRIIIEEKLRNRKRITITQIAKELGRDKSVISREISRNSYLKWDERTAKYKKIYSAGRAQGDYEARRKKAGRKSAIMKDKKLKQFIEDKILIEKWSPKEISGYIKKNNIKFFPYLSSKLFIASLTHLFICSFISITIYFFVFLSNIVKYVFLLSLFPSTQSNSQCPNSSFLSIISGLL